MKYLCTTEETDQIFLGINFAVFFTQSINSYILLHYIIDREILQAETRRYFFKKSLFMTYLI